MVAGKTNVELEQAILRDPEDEQSWLVYGDWLQQEGDPRGELIALSAKNLEAKAKALIEENVERFYGKAKLLLADKPFAGRTWSPMYPGAEAREYEHLAIHWTTSKYGFIDEVTVRGLDADGHLAGAVSALLECPLGRFVRALHFGIEDFGYEGPSGTPNWGELSAAVARAKPQSVRRLSWDSGGYQLSWTETGDLGPLLAETPLLESLSIELGRIELGDRLSLPKLREMRIESGGLDASNLRAIGAASWPSLERMTLFLGNSDYGGNATPADLEGILTRPEAFPKLRHLALCNSEIQGRVATAVVHSRLLRQLETLDLSKGTMMDDDAQVIVDHAEAFRHLAHLDLSENYLSAEFEEAVMSAIPSVDTSGQRLEEMDDEEYRFTVVGE